MHGLTMKIKLLLCDNIFQKNTAKPRTYLKAFYTLTCSMDLSFQNGRICPEHAFLEPYKKILNIPKIV